MSEMLLNGGFLRVTNNLVPPEKLHGRHNGTDYVWKSGESHDISVEAAAHIFGFGEEDKLRAMNRIGWAPRSDMMEAALDKLGMISFEEIQQVFALPRRPRKAGAKPLGGARSTVAGGTDGEASSPQGASPEGPSDDEDDDDEETAEGQI